MLTAKVKEIGVRLHRKNDIFTFFRVQLLTTKNGIPVEFVFMPDSANDVRALNAFERDELESVCHLYLSSMRLSVE